MISVAHWEPQEIAERFPYEAITDNAYVNELQRKERVRLEGLCSTTCEVTVTKTNGEVRLEMKTDKGDEQIVMFADTSNSVRMIMDVIVRWGVLRMKKVMVYGDYAEKFNFLLTN